MAKATIPCPHCGASVTGAVGKKIPCPECGRTLRIHDVESDDDNEELPRVDDLNADDFDDNVDDEIRREDPGRGRTYVHERCGRATTVSGGDFTHICDPFWPCSETYCCGCSGFVPLHMVTWMDTGETVAEFRRRMRSETPGMIVAWRYGLGFVLGALFGAAVTFLVMLANRVPVNNTGGAVAICAVASGAVFYLVGTMVLNSICKIDYRRRR